MFDCQAEHGKEYSLHHIDEPIEKKRRYVDIVILTMPVILKYVCYMEKSRGNT